MSDWENGAVARYAAEVAEHKRDPYSLVEEIVNTIENEINRGRAFRPSAASGALAPTSDMKRCSALTISAWP